MKVEVKRVDNSLPLPSYQTPGAVGFDFYNRNNERFDPGEIRYVPANLIIAVPQGFLLLIASRGSTLRKFGLIINPGFVDNDYCGDEDECLIQVNNLKDKVVMLPKGTRIAQGIFVAMAKAEFREVEIMNRPNRGGFGSTGH